LVHQLLRPPVIVDPTEAVVVPPVADSRLIHLPRQPLPSVQTDLNGEGKPSLDACVHESELRVHPVVIKEQALARFAGQFQLLGFPVGPTSKLQQGSTLVNTHTVPCLT